MSLFVQIYELLEYVGDCFLSVKLSKFQHSCFTVQLCSVSGAPVVPHITIVQSVLLVGMSYPDLAGSVLLQVVQEDLSKWLNLELVVLLLAGLLNGAAAVFCASSTIWKPMDAYFCLLHWSKMALDWLI